MPDILIRGLAHKTIKRLKEAAKRNGRSLQREAKSLIERTAAAESDEIAGIFAKWKAQFKGRKMTSSLDLIREGRER